MHENKILGSKVLRKISISRIYQVSVNILKYPCFFSFIKNHGAEWGRTFRVFFPRFQTKRAQRRTFCVAEGN